MARAKVRASIIDRLTTPLDFLKEAEYYLEKAKKLASKIPVSQGRYTDPKKVSEAAGMAYLAAELALEAVAHAFNEPIKQRFKQKQSGKQKIHPKAKNTMKCSPVIAKHISSCKSYNLYL